METGKSPNIKVYENFLSEEEHKFVLNYCTSCRYFYGEKDSVEYEKVTGMISPIYDFSFDSLEKTKDIIDIFVSKIESNLINQIKGLTLYRMYINCFAPSENPYFHIDGNEGEVTFLYYPNEKWDINDGGETQIFVNGTLCGITPTPNRLLQFDANLLHKATTFRNSHRFTIALKYGFCCDSSISGT